MAIYAIVCYKTKKKCEIRTKANATRLCISLFCFKFSYSVSHSFDSVPTVLILQSSTRQRTKELKSEKVKSTIEGI